MDIKPRGIPLNVLTLAALLRRLPKNHPQYPIIKESHGKSLAGFKGELEADYQLGLLPTNDYSILKDLRLPGTNSFFQLDTTLISRKILITFEIKKIKGTLMFDQNFHQLIRKLDGEMEKFPDPLTQISRHKRELSILLKQHKFPAIPIVNLVIVANPYSLIQATNNNLGNIIIPSDYIPERILQLEKLYVNEIFSEKEVKKLAKLLLKLHTPHIPDVLSKFGVSQEHLIRGVHCPSCESLPLVKRNSGWFCHHCKETNKDAHLRSLEDYALLMGRGINNKQLREFLLLNNSFAATRILRQLKLPYEGENKARVYQLPFPPFK